MTSTLPFSGKKSTFKPCFTIYITHLSEEIDFHIFQWFFILSASKQVLIFNFFDTCCSSCLHPSSLVQSFFGWSGNFFVWKLLLPLLLYGILEWCPPLFPFGGLCNAILVCWIDDMCLFRSSEKKICLIRWYTFCMTFEMVR